MMDVLSSIWNVGHANSQTQAFIGRCVMSATEIQLRQAVERTPDRVIERYRINRDWEAIPKE